MPVSRDCGNQHTFYYICTHNSNLLAHKWKYKFMPLYLKQINKEFKIYAVMKEDRWAMSLAINSVNRRIHTFFQHTNLFYFTYNISIIF
jgi:hypothetical protein